MNSKVVMGLGGTVDYEVRWDTESIQNLVALWKIELAELDPYVPIVDQRSLLVSLLGFIGQGTGGERFVSEPVVIQEFANRFDYRITLGGTCVRAAGVMSLVGLPSLVHLVSVDDNVRRLLPADVSYICSADSDSLDPHLIVQFPAGAELRVGQGSIVSQNPNRIIYAHDAANRDLRLHPDLTESVSGADLFLVSGFNVMRDVSALKDRLRMVADAALNIRPGGLVLFEDAGYHLPEIKSLATRAMGSIAQIYSMNQDELQDHLGRKIDLLNASEVSSAVYEMKKLSGSENVLVHSNYWALIVGDRAAELRPALSSAINMASARYLYGDALTIEQFTNIDQQAPRAESVVFSREFQTAVPGSVCLPCYELSTPSPTTIGLGDSFLGGFVVGFCCVEPPPGPLPEVV